MIKTILLFAFLFFSVLGFFILAVFVLLKISAPGGKGEIFLVVLPGENEKEYQLKIRWIEAVLSFTGLKDRITVASLDEKVMSFAVKEENGTDCG